MALEAAIELGNCIGFDESSDLYKKYFQKEKSPIEKANELKVELLFKGLDLVFFNKTEDASAKNILGNKTIGYLEGYGYYVLTHKLIGKTKYAVIKKYRDAAELFDSETRYFLYNYFKQEEEELHHIILSNFNMEDKEFNYFKEYYIYTKMLEAYVKYYNGKVPSDIVSNLVRRLNDAYVTYNPESEGEFMYDDYYNSFWLGGITKTFVVE